MKYLLLLAIVFGSCKEDKVKDVFQTNQDSWEALCKEAYVNGWHNGFSRAMKGATDMVVSGKSSFDPQEQLTLDSLKFCQLMNFK